jgi:hypothetical protein
MLLIYDREADFDTLPEKQIAEMMDEYVVQRKGEAPTELRGTVPITLSRPNLLEPPATGKTHTIFRLSLCLQE